MVPVRCRFWLSLVAWMVLLPLWPAFADYSPQPGDVLEISVAGVPALDRRLTVNPGGEIAYPLLGAISVSDLTLGDLKRRLEEQLAAKNVVRNPNVFVSVAEYGPIYVSGDVLKPGEYRYRPDMTVRNAIALAGGYDVQQNEARSTPAQIAYARGEFGAAAIEYARQEARAARIRAEIADATTFELGEEAKRWVDPAVLAEIVSIETRQLQADGEADTRQKAYLEHMVQTARDQVSTLEQAEQQYELTYEQQSRDAERSRELLQKSIGTIARAEDTQRATLQSQAQVSDVRSRAVQARTDLQQRLRNLETFDEERRSKLLDALQQAVTEAGRVRYRMEAAYDQMSVRGGAGVRQSGISASAVIRRRENEANVRITADLDTTLRSGDSVEVVLNPASLKQSALPFNPTTAPVAGAERDRRPAGSP